LESEPKLCIPFFFFLKICLKIGVKNELRQLPSLYNTYGINTLEINICLTLYSKFVKKRKITQEKKVFFFLEEHPNEKQKSSCQTITKLRIQSKW
jgi:hypothetical protein